MPVPQSRASFTSSYRAKLARADQHLDALYRETDGWGDPNPFRIARQSNADGSEHLFTLRFVRQPDVWRWSVLLGDALHNLRCALDHVVYALAINQTGKDPPDDDARLAFPICSDPEFFRRKNVQGRIASLNGTTRAALERTQPYNRLKPGQWFMPIWWLAQLNDIDKHRSVMLSPVAARLNDGVIGAEPGTYKVLWNEGPLIDGTPILKLTLTKPDPNVYVKLDCTAAVVLKLEGVRPLGLHPTLGHIRREVDIVCRYLSLFFV